jgi:tripartite-type tricarboxylate transporter receptor subunit TctC
MVAASILRFLSTGVLRMAMCAGDAGRGSAVPAEKSVSSDVYPVKPIRIIVASSPGTASDFSRARSGGPGAFYQQRIVIENRSGAGGLIGNTMVSKANADGRTLGMVDVTRIIHGAHARPASVSGAGGYRRRRSRRVDHNVLAVTPSIRRAPRPIRRYRARASASFNYASLGIGSASHLAGEVFTRAVGIHAMHMPFRNLYDSFIEDGARTRALRRVHAAGGHRAGARGRIRALAVMTPQRSRTAVGAGDRRGRPARSAVRQLVGHRRAPGNAAAYRRAAARRHRARAAQRRRCAELFSAREPKSTPERHAGRLHAPDAGQYLRFQALIREGGIKPRVESRKRRYGRFIARV